MDNVNYLKIPLFKLMYIDNITDFEGLSSDELESMHNEYSDEEIKSIYDSVKWAKSNPEYDFISLMPKLRVSNSDIYIYLCKIEESIKSIMK